MKKLKLETLEVTSFATTSHVARERGTVLGAARTNNNCPPQTYNPDLCGDTLYFDCTLGCSRNTDCPAGCVLM
jgi:hypothetical protein